MNLFRPHLRKQQNILYRGLIGKQHANTINTQPNARCWRLSMYFVKMWMVQPFFNMLQSA